GYDWNAITPDQVRKHVLDELAQHRGGIVTLHDIHARTATMLPQLLKDLKQQGYKLVALAPAKRCPDGGCRIHQPVSAHSGTTSPSRGGPALATGSWSRASRLAPLPRLTAARWAASAAAAVAGGRSPAR